MSRASKVPGLAELAELIGTRSVLSPLESVLQRLIRGLFREQGIKFREQAIASRVSRFDFLVGQVVLELKVKGSLADLIRQLDRYAEETINGKPVSGILVVTTKRQLLPVPSELHGVPIRAVWVGCL